MHAKLGKAIGPANFFRRRKCRSGIEVLNFSGDLRIILGYVEGCDFFDAAFAGQEVVPESADVVADRRNDAQAGDDHSALG